MSAIINTLTNQDYAGFDKLDKSRKDYKEMHIKMKKINKSNRNESSMSEFLSSPFSPVFVNLTAGSSAGENASPKLDKRDLLGKKASLEYPLKKFLASRRLYLYWTSAYIDEENQGWLGTDKERKIIGKDFKMQM